MNTMDNIDKSSNKALNYCKIDGVKNPSHGIIRDPLVSQFCSSYALKSSDRVVLFITMCKVVFTF